VRAPARGRHPLDLLDLAGESAVRALSKQAKIVRKEQMILKLVRGPQKLA
jgi:hypothetical protein